MNNYLEQFKNIIEDTLFGGRVKKFGKNPFTSTIDPLEFQIVQNYLEEGISLMTFLDILLLAMDLVKILTNQRTGIIKENTQW